MFASEKAVQAPLLTRQRCKASRCASTKVCLCVDSLPERDTPIGHAMTSPAKKIPDFSVLTACDRGMVVAPAGQLGRRY
jgi:hypothetical protein